VRYKFAVARKFWKKVRIASFLSNKKTKTKNVCIFLFRGGNKLPLIKDMFWKNLVENTKIKLHFHLI